MFSVVYASALLPAGLWGCSVTSTETSGSAPDQGFGEQARMFELEVVTLNGEPEADAALAPPPSGPRPAALAIVGADADSDAELWIPSSEDFLLRDLQTDSLWNLRGQAFQGPLKGAQLGQVAGYTVFWFSWSTAHHGVDAYYRFGAWIRPSLEQLALDLKFRYPLGGVDYLVGPAFSLGLAHGFNYRAP